MHAGIWKRHARRLPGSVIPLSFGLPMHWGAWDPDSVTMKMNLTSWQRKLSRFHLKYWLKRA